MLKIKFVFIQCQSKRDRNGNTYHSTTMIDTASGARVAMLCERNTADAIQGQLGLDDDAIVRTRKTIGKREFFKRAESMSYGKANDFIVCMNDAKRILALAIKNS